MKLIQFLYRRSWLLLLLAAMAGLLGGLFGAALIGLITRGVLHTGAGALAGWFFGLCLAHLLARSIAQIALFQVTQGAVLDIRIGLSRKLLAAPPQRLRQLGKPELLTILTKDVDTLIGALQVIPNVMTQTVIIVGCLAYMAWLSWQLSLVFLLALALCLTGYHLLQRYPLRQMVGLREKMGQLYGHFRDLVEGSRELQLNARRGRLFVDKVLAPDAEEYKRLYVKSFTGFALIANLGDVLFYLVIGLIFFVIPVWLPHADVILAAFIMVLLFLIGPISIAINSVPVLGQGGVAFARIAQLDADLAAAPRPAAAGNPFATGTPLRLELSGVCHHYPGQAGDRQFMLGPMNLRIDAGEILFIVGGNGSGKTTLAMLLLGLYLPEQGSLRLNGVAVDAATVGHYRSYFSAVFSDFHLFQHVLGEPGAAGATRAAAYLDKLGIGHKVTVSDDKFSTIDLSSGQRKRLALVLAYLEDSDVYVFDEWAADQDPMFKRVFYSELLPELKMRGKTVIVISHDDAYFCCADRVVRLEDGNLHVQAGPLRSVT